MEQNDSRFQVEMTTTKELMKEAYSAVMWHSWRTWVYVAAIALGFGLAGYRIYDAYAWSMWGYRDAWRDNAYSERLMNMLTYRGRRHNRRDLMFVIGKSANGITGWKTADRKMLKSLNERRLRSAMHAIICQGD